MRIIAPHFVAGLVFEDGRVSRAAPIIDYMIGWPLQKVVDYITRKKWTWD